MALESEEIKQLMLAHLQELMEDEEVYGWSVVLLYHATWLQHLGPGHIGGPCKKALAKACLGVALGGTIHKGTTSIFSNSQAAISRKQKSEENWPLQ